MRRGSGVDPDLDYCLEQLRRYDRDRYLAVLAAPPEAAVDLAVLFAFNLELALIPDSVTEPMLGRIRLQWWREALEELRAGRVRRHAVLTPLAALIARRPLDPARLEALIAAREFEIDREQPADMAALRRFTDDTAVGLLMLAAAALGVDPAKETVAAALRGVGTAHAFTGIARAALHLAGHHRVLLPVDLLARHGVSLALLYDQKPQPGLQPAIEELAQAARGELTDAARVPVPKTLLPVMRIGTLARAELARLRKHGHDLFDPRSVAGSPRDIWRLALCRWTGRW
jgi:phytoene/squalene synthetase